MSTTKYVGITGFTGFEQVERMLGVWKAHKKPRSSRRLHVGAMMSYKTLNGFTTRFQDVFPPKNRIASIFESDEAYNCLHYADYDGHSDLANTLTTAIRWGGIGLHAIQLDMTWPDPGKIACGTHMSRMNIQVILQIGARAFDDVGNDPDRLVERLGEYHGAISGVLLDKSMGRGIGMDAKALLPFARAIRKSLPEFGLGVAGGLGPETMHLARPLVRDFSGISLDTQAALCPGGDAMNPMDMGKAEKYLIESLRILD